MSPRSPLLPSLLAAAWLAAATVAAGQAPTSPRDDARVDHAVGMRLVGRHDLQARSAYQPVIHRQQGRWIAYIGHHGGRAPNPLTGAVEDNGTSILDVTDPGNPLYLHHIPGAAGAAEGGGAQMVRACDGDVLPHGARGHTYLLRTLGNSAQEVWDVTDPRTPTRVTTVVAGLNGTHKNWWECDTGIAYLVSDGRPSGWRSNRITKIYDLSDPAHPTFIRDFGLVGQEPGATGTVPPGVHGPISTGPAGNRVYFAYGTGADGVIQVVDRKKLLAGEGAPTPAHLLAPQVGRLDMTPDQGGHTAFPILGVPIADFAKDAGGSVRDFLFVTSEALATRCHEPRHLTFLVDVTHDARPFSVSTYQVPAASGGFCERGGRFGPHATNESLAPVFYRKVVFVSYFNAGVRAVDVRDPYHPVEIGSFVPAVTDKTTPTCGAGRCATVVQTNNVEVDERGYVYIVDRASTGLHILQLTARR